jgi:hypothetical protein
MSVREFASPKALINYTEQNGLVYVWAIPVRQRLLSAAFTERQELLLPDQYEIVDVRTSYGVRRAMLFPKTILQAEFTAKPRSREALAFDFARRERPAGALRAALECERLRALLLNGQPRPEAVADHGPVSYSGLQRACEDIPRRLGRRSHSHKAVWSGKSCSSEKIGPFLCWPGRR